MPSEQPNEKMDKVLKAYAKKRREDSTQIEMDLPTRNMLQAEVKRTLGEVPVPSAPRPRPRFAWWPQLIIGVASAAALAIAVLVWKLPSRSETSESNVAAVSQSAPAPANESATTTWTDESKNLAADTTSAAKDGAFIVENGIKADAPQTFQLQTPAPALASQSKATEPVAQPIPQRQIEAEKKTEVTAPAAIADNASTTPAATAPAPSESASPATPTGAIAAAAPTPQLATRSVAKTVAGNFAAPASIAQQPEKERIQFSQINNRSQYRENLNSPPLPKVLTNFRLERTGTNLLVRDSDGSVYSGKAFVNSVTPNTTQAFVIKGFGGEVNSANEIPDDNFAFRVSGYNKKLRQKIIFTGNVTNATQNVVAITNALNQQNTGQNQPTLNILLNGRVQVGRNSEFTIEAAPTTK